MNGAKWVISATAVLLCAVYLVFGWESFDYPPWDPRPCYSPNHTYYITRHQSLWEKLWRTYPDEYGTARLYDKSGKLLHEGKTEFGGDELGPRWFEDEVSMGEDNNRQLWIAPLPTSPGEHVRRPNCF